MKKNKANHDRKVSASKGEPLEDQIRLNKLIARAGVCSRREADKLIANGEIKVNDQVVRELGLKVHPSDTVTYKGRKLEAEKKIYVLLNKPRNVITTVIDPQGRRTVMDLVKNATRLRIYPVGRLDRETTGLLMLTNDGDLAKKLTHPSHEIEKIYHVELDKPVSEEGLNELRSGITLEDGFIKVDDIQVLDSNPTQIGVRLHSGRNRIVRRLFEHLGFKVIKLDRVVFAGLTKWQLPRKKWRYLKDHEVIELKHLLRGTKK